MVLVTHERDIAQRARRVVVLHDGYVSSDSAPGLAAEATQAAG